MGIEISWYIILLILFCAYFYFDNKDFKLEIIFLFILIYFAPDIMFRDWSNYLVTIARDYPFIKEKYIEPLLRIAYPLCYVSVYYLISIKLPNKELRLAFITMTFATLGFNQLYLCFAFFLFLIQHSVKNKIIRGVLIILSLKVHLSTFPLYIIYIYKWNKKVALATFIGFILLFFINPHFYLNFSNWDQRVSFYTALERNRTFFDVYRIRSQIFMNLNMLLFSIWIKNYRLTILVILIFLFSLSISSIHAVFVGRGVEMLYLLFFLVLFEEHNNFRKFRLFALTTLSVYFINNTMVAFLYNIFI